MLTPWLSNRSWQRASWLSAASTRTASTALGRNKFFRNPQPYWNNSQIAAPTAAHEFSKTKRALIAAQNVLETGARSSFHKPLPFNEDRVFQQHRAIALLCEPSLLGINVVSSRHQLLDG